MGWTYLIITSYFSRPGNTHCHFIADQAHAIENAGGFKVVVLYSGACDDYTYEGIPVFGFGAWHRGASWFPRIAEWVNVRRMKKALRRSGVDMRQVCAVHGHQILSAGCCLALKRKYPHVRTFIQFHEADVYCLRMVNISSVFGWIKLANYFLTLRKRIEKMDVCVPVSRNVGEMLRTFPHYSVYRQYGPMESLARKLRWFRAPRIQRLSVLHNGVPAAFVNSDVHKPSDIFVIGCAGRIENCKGYDYLLKALSMLKNRLGKWELRFLGDGGQTHAIRRMIHDAGLDEYVHLIPLCSYHDMPAFYRGLDLFVLPSYFEAFGCVFTEAWVSGTPFITCEGQGMDDLIRRDDRSLWLAQPCDSVDLAEKIYNYYQNRPRQVLAGEVRIEPIITDFLKKNGLLA